MKISDILINSLTKNNRNRVIKIAQYFYKTNRCSISALLFVTTKPFY